MIRINLALKKGPVAVVSSGGAGDALSSLRSLFSGRGSSSSTSKAVQELAKEVLIRILISAGVYFASDYALSEKKAEELGVIRSEASSLSAESSRLDVEIAKRAQYEAEKKRIEDYEKILTAKLSTIDRLMEDRDSASRMLRELAEIIPGESWLSFYSVEGERVQFKGRAMDVATVNSFLSKVNSSPNYRDANPSMREFKDDLTGKTIQDFEIQASRRSSNEF